MSRRCIFACLAALSMGVVRPSSATAADRSVIQQSQSRTPADFRNAVYHDSDGDHRYVVFIPPGYDASRKWPVILFLHGAGERGHDGRQQLTVGLGAIVEQNPAAFPAIIVFPQVEETDERILTAWAPQNPDGRRALAMLREVEQKYSIDTSHRILAGWSMGGYGVWQIAAASEPIFWSAAISVSGGAPDDVAARFPKNLPFWTLHGANDRIVEPSQMTKAVESAGRAGSKVSSIMIAGEGHGVWQVVFGRDDVRRWMLDPGSVSPSTLDWSAETVSRVKKDNPLPESEFHASAVITRAVAIRIGNDAFVELGRGIPEAIPRERLEGKVKDIERSIAYGGAQIHAGIRNIRWSADLAAAEIRAAEAERLIVRVGLQNLTLHCASGDLAGGGYTASCGPFDVILGRYRPVWIEVSIRPRVVKGAIDLTENEIRFAIPDDNWIVTEPEWAKASGKGLTPDLVKVGVVGGMYRAKDRVEAAVRELIPPLIERIERRLVQVPPESLASLLWPLPTAPPRIRLIPEGIRTDSGGVSVTVGLAVEGPASSTAHIATKTPITEDFDASASVGISPEVLTSVASVFADDPGARIDFRDLTDSPLAQLGSEQLLRDISPALTQGGDYELRNVLSLAEPFQLEILTAGSGSPQELELNLHAPKVRLEISRRRRDRSSRWLKCIDCDLNVSQKLTVKLTDSDKEGRLVSMIWSTEPHIEGQAHFADGFNGESRELRSARLVDTFRSAWRQWTANAGDTSTVDDLAVGGARLRLDAMPVRGGRVWLEFEPGTSRVKR